MSSVVIFAGTTEGRELAEFLARQEVRAHAFVATEYGETLLRGGGSLTVHQGRLDEKQMEETLRELKPEAAVDATHPYAAVVSGNIRRAAEAAGIRYIRLLRAEEAVSEEDCVSVDSVEEAAVFLAGTEGKILAATGSKELAKYTAIPGYRERVTARVLSTAEAVAACEKLGFRGKNLICMQGPFSEELNTALLRQIGARWLVTKESGKEGGFGEKIRAAKKAGARVVLIGRPDPAEEGADGFAVRRLLCGLLKIRTKREITLAGIGMGGEGAMTEEARQALNEAELVIGSGRMLAEAHSLGKPCFDSYKAEEIREYVENHPEYERVVILLSGDVGFYSGARKLGQVFADQKIRICCGIASPVYLCGRLSMPWEDVKLLSLHGRAENLIGAVRANAKVFALAGGGDGVNALCEKLLYYGFSNVTVYVGERLSYPEERIRRGTPKELLGQSFDPLCSVLIENPNPEKRSVCGLEDEAFIRGKVPMTKSEVRSVSLAKLGLTRDAVVYDVGAGTGSVSVEAALLAPEGAVYAVEKKEEAVALLKENRQKFAADNLFVVPGLAPEALEELPAPTHVFIGGSSGNLRQIMELALAKNPGARIVLNAIALETAAEALECVKTLPVKDADICCVTVGKAREVGNYHMMMGQNPVYIISCTGDGTGGAA